MPWSDWQDPFTWDEPRGADASVVASREGSTEAPHVADRSLDDRNNMVEEARARAKVATVTVSVTDAGSDPSTVPANDVASYGVLVANPDYDGASVTLQQRIYYLSGWPGMTGRHHGFLPSELRDGQEGVDYGPIPGVDPADPDQFVQWEDGAVTVPQAWVGTLTGVHSGRAGSSLYVLADDTLGNGADGWTPDVPAWSTASPEVAYFNATGAEQEFSYAFEVPVRNTDRAPLALVLDPDLRTAPLQEPDKTGGAFGVNGAPASVALRLLMPRWRYWIPERLPLRQRQRDDGLGMSTARWRAGRSRQSSNRWKGYL